MPATLLLTVEQIAAELHIARRQVFELIRDGQLVSVKIGRSRRIRSADLAESCRAPQRRRPGPRMSA